MRRQAPRGMSERDVFLVAFLGLGRRAAYRIRGGRVGRPAGTGAVALATRLAQAGRWGTPRNRLAHRCRGATQLVVTRRGGLAAAIAAARVEELNAIGLNADLRPFFARRLVVPAIHTQIPFHVNRAAFAEVLAACLAWRSHTVTSMNSVSSRRSPSRPVHDRLVAMRSSVTAVPLGILRSSGSNVRRPIRNTLFKSGIAWFLSRPRIHRSLASGPQLSRSRKTGPTLPARAGTGTRGVLSVP